MSTHPRPARAGRADRDRGQPDPGERAAPHGEESAPAPAARPAEAGTTEDPPEGYEAL